MDAYEMLIECSSLEYNSSIDAWIYLNNPKVTNETVVKEDLIGTIIENEILIGTISCKL